MKNIKWKAVLALPLAVAVFIGIISVLSAESAIKITIRNNRSHNISFAFCWAGLDYQYDTSKGWYNVKAGETRTLTFKDAIYAFTSQNFGYYATGGGATWQGKEDSSGYMTFWVHPSQAFTGNHDDRINGGKRVIFRNVNLTRESQEDGRATLTFKP